MLKALFSAMDRRHIRYCVLRNYETLPDQVPGSDIDLLVHHSDRRTFHNLVLEACEQTGWFRITVYKKDFQIVHYRLAAVSPEIAFLRLDVMSDLGWRGTRYLDGGVVLANCRDYRGLRVPTAEMEATILLVNSVLFRGSLKERYHHFVTSTIGERPQECREIACGIAGDSLASGLIESAQQTDVAAVYGLKRRLAKAVVLRALRRNPLRALRDWLGFCIFVMGRAISPPGYFVALVGPDGVGKTTVADSLQERLEDVFPHITYLHLRPGLLPSIKRVLHRGHADGSSVETSDVGPKGKPPGLAGSLLRLLYYAMDYWVGYYLKIYPKLVRGGLVIADRYHYDYVVDQRQKNVNLRPWLARLLTRTLPNPHLVALLTTYESVAAQRKPEIEAEEVRRQINSFEELLQGSPAYARVENTDTLSRTTESVIGAVVNGMQRRYTRQPKAVRRPTEVTPPPGRTVQTSHPLIDRSGWKYLLPVDRSTSALVIGAGSRDLVFSLSKSAAAVVVADSEGASLHGTRDACNREGLVNVHCVSCAVSGALPFPDGCFNAIVALEPRGPLDPMLQECGRLLVDGGALYLGERLTRRRPASYFRRRLGSQGFDQPVSYALLPNPGQRKLLLPLGLSRRGTRHGLRLHTATQWPARMKKALYTLVAATGAFRWWPPPYALLAHKRGASSSGPLGTVRASLGLDSMVPVVFLPSAGYGSKATIQIQSPAGAPLAYAKIADAGLRDAEIQNEADSLEILDGLDLATGRTASLLAVEKGESYSLVLISPIVEHDAQSPKQMTWEVLSFLIELARKTAMVSDLDGSPFSSLIEKGLSDQGAGMDAPATLSDALEAAKAGLDQRSLPFVLAHRDFVSWNVRMGQGKISVVDWEWARQGHLPYQDLFHFVLHGPVNFSGRPPVEVARKTFFRPNRKLAFQIKEYSLAIGLQPHLSYQFFTLYLIDWVLLQMKVGNHQHVQAEEYLVLLDALSRGGDFSPSRWLGGLLSP